MEFEFDNEIDAILRQARNGDFASAVNPKSDHLDADEISAFAENALPEKTKTIYTEHLADCGRCRKILSNIISLNAEAELETASAAVSVPENAVETSIPWYRKLFIFPQLTYIMGALVLTFGGFLAYSVVQNSDKKAETSSISSVKERPQNVSGASSDGETTITESSRANSNAGTMQSNSAANVSSPAVTSNSAAMSSNSSAANSSAAPRKEPAARRQEEKTASPITSAQEESENSAGSAAAPAPPAMQMPPPLPVQNKPEESRKTDDKAGRSEILKEKKSADENDASDLAIAGRQVSEIPPAPKSTAKIAVSSKARQAGGKNFTRKNGVWYDVNYNGQSTTNISRSSEDYRKLDSGLRSIADNLGGTVVIIWKDRAYRIE